MFIGCLIALGLYTLLYYLYDNLRTPVYLLYNTWLQRHETQQMHLMEKYGNWVAVTGATDGIGKAYARELARWGFNIVLVSKTEAKLKAVALEIETEFNVETFIISCDFSKGAEVYNNLFNKLSERPIGILVNNVGIGHNPPGTINSFSPDHIWDVININIGSATQLSRHFINKWHQDRKKGLIVNISSVLEQQPCPFGSVYGGSKAYMRSFTQALQEETKHLGISVQLCSPSYVVTKINNYSQQVMQGHLLIPQADVYAKWAVRTLGKVDETTGYFWHGVQKAILNIIPYRWKTKIFLSVIVNLIDNLAETKPHRD